MGSKPKKSDLAEAVGALPLRRWQRQPGAGLGQSGLNKMVTSLILEGNPDNTNGVTAIECNGSGEACDLPETCYPRACLERRHLHHATVEGAVIHGRSRWVTASVGNRLPVQGLHGRPGKETGAKPQKIQPSTCPERHLRQYHEADSDRPLTFPGCDVSNPREGAETEPGAMVLPVETKSQPRERLPPYPANPSIPGTPAIAEDLPPWSCRCKIQRHFSGLPKGGEGQQQPWQVFRNRP